MIRAGVLALLAYGAAAASTVEQQKVLRERVPVSAQDAAKMFSEIEQLQQQSVPGDGSHGRRLGADFCSGKSLPNSNEEGSGSATVSGGGASGTVDFYYNYPFPGYTCGSNPHGCLTDNACIEFTTSITELTMDATTTAANLGIASVSGVGCLDCVAKITPTMTFGIFMDYSSSKGYYEMDVSMAFNGAIDFDFKFGLEDPTIAISSVKQERIFTGSEITAGYPSPVSIISVSITPKVDMIIGKDASVQATGTLAVMASADASLTGEVTVSSDGSMGVTANAITGLNLPELAATDFALTSGGTDVEVTIMPYLDIDFKLGPEYSDAEWPVVEMSTKMEFPIKSTMDIAGGTIKFDVDIVGKLKNILGMLQWVTFIGDCEQSSTCSCSSGGSYGWNCGGCATCDNCPTESGTNYMGQTVTSTKWSSCEDGIIAGEPDPVSTNVFTLGPTARTFAGTHGSIPAPAPSGTPAGSGGGTPTAPAPAPSGTPAGSGGGTPTATPASDDSGGGAVAAVVILLLLGGAGGAYVIYKKKYGKFPGKLGECDAKMTELCHNCTAKMIELFHNCTDKCKKVPSEEASPSTDKGEVAVIDEPPPAKV